MIQPSRLRPAYKGIVRSGSASSITIRGLCILAPALLAACGEPARDTGPTNTMPADNGYAAKVAALPEKLRAGVMLRAIRDAGQNCQQVVEMQPAGGPGAWVATCDDQNHWVVAIAGDGTATVANAKDLTRRH